MCPTNNNPRFRKYPPTVKGKNNPRNSQGMRAQQASNKQRDITANIISIRRAELLGEDAIQSYFEENPARSFREKPADIRTKNVIGRRIKIEEMEEQFATQENELNRTSFERIRWLPPPYVKSVTGVVAMREAHARLQFERHLEKSKKNFNKIKELPSSSVLKPISPSSQTELLDFPRPTEVLLREDENIFDAIARDEEKGNPDEEKDDPSAFIGRPKRTGPRLRLERPHFRFGRLIVDEAKLKKNEISVGFHPDTRLTDKPRIKNRKNISPEFKDVFQRLLSGNRVVDVSDLNSRQKKYLKDFIKISKKPLIVLTGQGLFKNINEIIQRFDVLTGMIRAGNNSKKIVNELSSVINQLVQTGTISVEKAINVTKSLIADI